MEGCRACFNCVCLPCNRLVFDYGHKMNTRHCERHCRHKPLRSKLSIVRGVDNLHRAKAASP